MCEVFHPPLPSTPPMASSDSDLRLFVFRFREYPDLLRFLPIRFQNTSLSFLSLLVWISLVNFKQGISLLKLVFSLSFPGILWVWQGQKILGKFWGFSLVKTKQPRKGTNQGNPFLPTPFASSPKLIWDPSRSGGGTHQGPS